MNVSRFQNDASECRRICSLLDDFISGELSVEASRELLDHLDQCRDCNAEKEGRERLRSAMKDAYDKQPVPEALLRRIEGQLEPRSSAPRRWMSLTAAALLLALTVAGVFLLQENYRISRGLAEVVDNHLKCQMLQNSPPERLPLTPAWMQESLLPLPQTYRLATAHFCQLNERQFVHYVFEGESKFSLILEMLPPEDRQESPGPPIQVAPELIHFRHASVARTEAGDYAVYLVGDERTGETPLHILMTLLPALRRSLV